MTRGAIPLVIAVLLVTAGATGTASPVDVRGADSQGGQATPTALEGSPDGAVEPVEGEGAWPADTGDDDGGGEPADHNDSDAGSVSTADPGDVFLSLYANRTRDVSIDRDGRVTAYAGLRDVGSGAVPSGARITVTLAGPNGTVGVRNVTTNESGHASVSFDLTNASAGDYTLRAEASASGETATRRLTVGPRAEVVPFRSVYETNRTARIAIGVWEGGHPHVGRNLSVRLRGPHRFGTVTSNVTTGPGGVAVVAFEPNASGGYDLSVPGVPGAELPEIVASPAIGTVGVGGTGEVLPTAPVGGGQTVPVAGFVVDDGAPAATEPYRLVVTNRSGFVEVVNETVTTDANGTFRTTVRVPDAPPRTRYSLSLATPNGTAITPPASGGDQGGLEVGRTLGWYPTSAGPPPRTAPQSDAASLETAVSVDAGGPFAPGETRTVSVSVRRLRTNGSVGITATGGATTTVATADATSAGASGTVATRAVAGGSGPVADEPVTVELRSDVGAFPLLLDRTQVRTNASGRARATLTVPSDLPRGQVQVSASIGEVTETRRTRQVRRYDVAAGIGPGWPRPPTVEVSAGRVRDGAPVTADTTAILTGATFDSSVYDTVAGSTDADGRATLQFAPPADASNYARVTTRVRSRDAAETVAPLRPTGVTLDAPASVRSGEEFTVRYDAPERAGNVSGVLTVAIADERESFRVQARDRVVHGSVAAPGESVTVQVPDRVSPGVEYRVSVRAINGSGFLGTADRTVTVTGPAASPIAVETARLWANETRTLNVTLESAPEGLSAYNLTLTAAPDLRLTDVEAGEVGNGSDRNGTVTVTRIGDRQARVAATDAADAVRPGDEEVLLARVTVEGIEPLGGQVSASVDSISSDTGDGFVPPVPTRPSLVAVDRPVVAAGDVDARVNGSATTTLTLHGVPDGLSSVGVTARLDNGSVADLAAVRPGSVGVENGTASGFTIDARSRDSVTLTASDVGDAVGPGEGPVTVARLTANGTTAGETDLNVTVGSVTDDAGTGVATGAHDGVVRVRSGPVALFPNGVPGGTTDRPPTDVDGDGIFEDLDGDGQFTFVDVIEFVFAIDTLVGTDLSQAQTAALDHSDDGAVGFTDVVDLVFQL